MYLLIDFNATRRYSHHWSYLKKYQNLLAGGTDNYQIWLPINAHDEILSQLHSNYSNFLISNIFGYERRENLVSWFHVRITDLGIKLATKFLTPSQAESLKKIVSKIYTEKPFQRIRQLESSGEEINLVFPTADSLAIRLAGRCLESGIKVGRVCFRLSSSHKDTFKVEEVEKHLKSLIRMYPSSRISIGFETMAHKENLLDFGFEESNLYWTPAPPVTESVTFKDAVNPLRIGFLGVARPNKGFVEIPGLIRSLISSDVVFEAYVQQAIYPWPDYIHALNELIDNSEHVTILAANLSETELNKILGEIDVLVLPYSPKDYKLAGSGLLFEASDLGIPVITKQGVAFDWDIEQYFLGFTYKKEEDFTRIIKESLLQKQNYGFNRYNSDRLLAALQFLGLK